MDIINLIEDNTGELARQEGDATQTPTANPTPGKTWSELIRCPECGTDQWALVEQERGHPFAFYHHTCQHCGHVILESEWNKVGESEKTADQSKGAAEGERRPGRTRLVYDKTKREISHSASLTRQSLDEGGIAVAVRVGAELEKAKKRIEELEGERDAANMAAEKASETSRVALEETENALAQLTEAQNLRQDANAAFQAMREAGLMAGTRPVTLSNLTAKMIARMAELEVQLGEEKVYHERWYRGAVELTNKVEVLQAQLTEARNKTPTLESQLSIYVANRASVQAAIEKAEGEKREALARVKEVEVQLAEANTFRDNAMSFITNNCGVDHSQISFPDFLAQGGTNCSLCLTAKRDQLYNALEPVERHRKIGAKVVELSEGEWAAIKAALGEVEQPAPDSPWATFPQLLQSITEVRGRALAAEAGAARQREILCKVETYLASEDGPLNLLWSNGDICGYDDNPCDTWVEALLELRNPSIDPAILGYGTEWPEVLIYRAVLKELGRTMKSPAEIKEAE